MILVKVLMGASEVLLIRYSFGWERSTTLDIIDLGEQDRQFSPLPILSYQMLSSTVWDISS